MHKIQPVLKIYWSLAILFALSTWTLALSPNARKGQAGAATIPRVNAHDTQTVSSSSVVHLPLVLYQPAPDDLKPVINMPYLGASAPPDYFEPAIFWFGQVTPTINNADVRLWHYDDYMKVVIHVVDRRLWYAPNPSPETLEEWDAVSLFLNLDGHVGTAPSSNSYRLVAQVAPGDKHQAAYKGDGSGWLQTQLSYTAVPTWRGDFPNNDNNDKGWALTYIIPFSSFGLTERPAEGTKWGLSVAIHDRDEADGGPLIADQVWPEKASSTKPATWGELRFGLPGYNPPAAEQQGETTIRSGLNGAEVLDGHVGGHGNCGSGLDHWSEWGEKNYAGYGQMNIQNQWDISDYPCFSKYFVTFPLNELPAAKVILEATLSMTRFGNAGGGDWGEPPDSHIQVSTVIEDWDEQTLNWNNAPRALENVSSAWVQPVQTSAQQRFDWDVSRAVAEAYQAGKPLRLALYSTDGDRHSGKYFWTSDSGSEELDTSHRPTLTVIWGDAGR